MTQRELSHSTKKDHYYMSRNIAIVSNIDRLLESIGHVQPQEERMIALYGLAGTGKTTAGQWLVNNRQSYATGQGKTTYVRSCPFLSNYAFAETLLKALGQSESSLIRAMNMLTNQLATGDILIVDECDYLSDSCLEILRTIHDITGATIIMIGEYSFYGKLAKHSRLLDRTTHLEFMPLDLGDISLLAKNRCKFELKPDLLEALLKETEGNARRLTTAFSLIEKRCTSKNWKSCDLATWGDQPFKSELAKLPQFVGRSKKAA
jgi:DNA transposition AAA+ family ATPase